MSTPGTQPKVALYARVSTTGNGQDPELQLEELRQVAAQRGWTIYKTYVDDGVSGMKASRPALDQMMKDAQAGRFQILAVWRLDRLGRDISHLLTTINTLSGYGVEFASIRDVGIDTTTPTGRLLLHLLGAFANFERELIRERVVAGVRRAQASGKHCGRPRVEVDLRPVVAMFKESRSLKEISRITLIPRPTIRRRLLEAGMWPFRAES